MSLKRNILDLRKRKEIVLQGGGEDAIKKQAAMGKLTARERIEGILDKGSFHEYDIFVEHQSKDFDMDKKVLHGDGVVIGTGTVYGEPVAIYAQDFTVAGGSLGLMHARKITKIMDHAIKMRMPIYRYQRLGWCTYPGRGGFTGRLWRNFLPQYTGFRCYPSIVRYSGSLCWWSRLFSGIDRFRICGR